jgi:ppGpp synthetase/RelA/SpoT-type nucleotidyltranferase
VPELSRSQIDKLGRRLRRAGVGGLSDADRNLLEQLIASHGPALAAVQERLSEELGVHVTSRTKTTGTLVEKLQRNRGMALSRMQDIAGVRLVMEMNRSEQDELVDVIVELFPGADKTDRRQEPSYGYRAVHVVVEMDQRFVEIQVRTVLQDLWAQMIERLADVWGRGIRYGEPPNDPDAEVAEGTTRRELFEALMIQAERIHLLELGAVRIADGESASEAISSMPEELQRFQRLKEQHRALEEETREFYRGLGLLK